MLPRRTRRQPAEPVSTFVVFTVGDRRFALPTGRVEAVSEIPGYTPLPAAGRPEVLGLVAHRGRAVALVDLDRCLGTPGAAGRAEAPASLCVVVAHAGRRLGFPVDELEGLARVSGTDLPPECETFDPAEAIFGADGEEAS